VTVVNVDPATVDGTTGDDIIAPGETLAPSSEGDFLHGLAGHDILDGGFGADSMEGGEGDDTYYVDNIGDLAIEVLGEGYDKVYSSVNFTLGVGLNELHLTGTAVINGTGNDLSNLITGNSAANVIDGGAGADNMAGGLGNDTYVVDDQRRYRDGRPRRRHRQRSVERCQLRDVGQTSKT